MRIAVAGSVLAFTKLFEIEGTPYFVCRCTGITPPTSKVYTIDAGLIKEVASWTEGGRAPKATLNGQEILNLAPDGQAIEVRKAPTFDVSERRSAPKEILTNWVDMIDERSTITISIPASVSIHLIDCQILRGFPSWMDLNRAFRPCSPSAPSDTLTFFKLPAPNVDLTVYDAVGEKIAAKLEFPYAYDDLQQISANRFAVVDNRLGGTITVYELPAAQIVAIHRPMFLAIDRCHRTLRRRAGLVHLWLRNSQQRSLPLAVDWLVLATVLIVPSLYRLVIFDFLVLNLAISLGSGSSGCRDEPLRAQLLLALWTHPLAIPHARLVRHAEPGNAGHFITRLFLESFPPGVSWSSRAALCVRRWAGIRRWAFVWETAA